VGQGRFASFVPRCSPFFFFFCRKAAPVAEQKKEKEEEKEAVNNDLHQQTATADWYLL